MKKYLIVLLLTVPFLTSAQVFDRDLFYGMRGNEQVKEMQEFLADKGFYSGPITGNFFSLTLTGVKKFQITHGITPASGYFGLKTRVKANAILSGAVAESAGRAVHEKETIISPTTTSNADTIKLLSEQIGVLQRQLDLIQQAALAATMPRDTNTEPKKREEKQDVVVVIPSVPQSQTSSAPSIPKEPVFVPMPTPQATHAQTSTPSSNPPPSSNSISIVNPYSSYNFDYQWNGNTLTCPMTPRDIVIKKAVFEILESELQMLNTLRGFEADGFKLAIRQQPPILRTKYTLPGTNPDKADYISYSLEASDQNTFVYFSDNVHLLPGICRDGSVAQILPQGSASLTDITDQGRNVYVYLNQKGIGFLDRMHDDLSTPAADLKMDIRVSPIMSRWEVWDNTTNKPVKIK